MRGKIFVTGGAGFLARAIYAKARADQWDATFVAFSTDEEKHRLLRQSYPEVKTVLGDVEGTPPQDLAGAMDGCDYVIHAAGVKFIRTAEENPIEAHRVNVEGSLNVARAALIANVGTVVGISTDKACQPANLYGLTKATMEHHYRAMNKPGRRTRFLTVRYGNVVGSTGSVIPLWRRQMATSGVIGLTRGSMSRFWMSPFDAVELIEYATEYSGRPDVTLIRLCPAMSMQAVAAAVIEGFRPGNLQQDQVLIHAAPVGPEEKDCEGLVSEMELHRAYLTTRDDTLALLPAHADAVRENPASVLKEPYTSCNPREWVTRERMIAMIREGDRL